MKKVVLTENELIDMVKSIVKNLNEDDASDFTSDPERTKLDPREKDIKQMFGKYRQHVPGDVLRHLRKNPQSVFDALYEIYGEKAFDYLNKAKGE